jgi:hypothetical protein
VVCVKRGVCASMTRARALEGSCSSVGSEGIVSRSMNPPISARRDANEALRWINLRCSPIVCDVVTEIRIYTNSTLR